MLQLKTQTNYYGSKRSSGVIQQIINEVPKHDTYIEAFAGSATLARTIKEAERGYIIEASERVAKHFMQSYPNRYQLEITDFTTWWVRHKQLLDRVGVFIYMDPPYVHSTRTDVKKKYDCELSDEQHADIVQIFKTTAAAVALSGYAGLLYNDLLRDYRKIEIPSMTRGGLRTETVWFNYASPVELHDYTQLGKNRTDRQRIHRKVQRHIATLQELPVKERNAIIEAIRNSSYK